MSTSRRPAVWFPAVRCGTGADVFTETLAGALQKYGVPAEIKWLPHRAEFAPRTVPAPQAPTWATIVHINSWLHPRFIPDDLPVVATLHHSIHDPDLGRYKGWLKSIYHKHWISRVESATLRRADHVVAVSRFAAETARAALLDRRMQVIPNGVDVERFYPPAERTPHKPFRLLYVGGWKKLKGVDLLAPIMRELGGEFELRYTGGPVANTDHVRLPPNMRDIGRLQNPGTVVAAMQEADAFLFPSRSEGFGLVVAEAMACGLPVIATRGSSLLEVVNDGVTGILCAQDDVAEFASAVHSLASNPTMYQRASHEARRRAESNFSISDMITRYLTVYEHGALTR